MQSKSIGRPRSRVEMNGKEKEMVHQKKWAFDLSELFL